MKPMGDYINYVFEHNKDEVVIIVDEKNEYKGLESRKVMRQNNLWHRSSAILVFSKNEQDLFIYVHKRAKMKDYCPSYYSIGFGGVLSENENFLQNSVKELYEESGIIKKPEQLFDIGLIKCDSDCSKSFVRCYLTFIPPDYQTTPQLSEVEFISKIPMSNFDKFFETEKITQISRAVYHHVKDKLKDFNLDEIYKITI